MNGRIVQSPRRGWPAQRRQREAEQAVRAHAVAFQRWALRQGLHHSQAARHLGLAPGTLAFWDYRWQRDGLAPHPLGRPCRRSPRQIRTEAIDLMRSEAAAVSLAALQATFPALARREAQSLRSRFRTIWKRDNRRLIHRLTWHRPRAVWAMDHAEPPRPIDGRWRYLLAVRDLASGCQLAWQPVLDESAETTLDVLQWLFLEHGPPLVLKSDNGSGFIAARMQSFLARWHVRPLFSPPCLPEYNGAIEAGNGALKTRTHERAALHGRAGHWTADDCETARRMANELNYPRGPLAPTPLDRFQAAPALALEDRDAFERTAQALHNQERLQQDYPLDTDLGHAAQAAIDRVALSRALVEHGFLSFTRRSITPPIKSHFPLNIS